MTPYVYKEYPRRLHQYGGAVCSVTTDEEKAAKLAEGWSLVPVLEPPVPVVEAAPIEAPRRGRPRREAVN